MKQLTDEQVHIFADRSPSYTRRHDITVTKRASGARRRPHYPVTACGLYALYEQDRGVLWRILYIHGQTGMQHTALWSTSKCHPCNVFEGSGDAAATGLECTTRSLGLPTNDPICVCESMI